MTQNNEEMTDKQIIVDGVEVSGCPHLIEDYQWWNIAGREEHDINTCALSFDEYRDFEEDDFCKENPNCYYKQLKRKEQECEELKEENKELHSLVDLIKTDLMKSDMENDDLIVQNDKLKEENEKLKKEIKDLLEKPEIQDKILWKIEDKKMTEGLNLRIYVLEQALKEIKEIAMDETYVGFWDEQISLILKKINECEGGDGN